jgi:uncharacterized protein YebE (UPF0316 family)
MQLPFISPEIYAWIVLPALIFIARIFDVSLETIRVVYISRGIVYLAPIIAFFEIMIWLLAMEVVLDNLSNIATFIAFAAGFASGTYIGLLIEEKLSIGKVFVRVVTGQEGSWELAEKLRASGFGVTSIEGEGSRDRVRIILSLVNRRDLPVLMDLIAENQPDAFYSIEDVRSVHRGVFRPQRSLFQNPLALFRARKEKNGGDTPLQKDRI